MYHPLGLWARWTHTRPSKCLYCFPYLPTPGSAGSHCSLNVCLVEILLYLLISHSILSSNSSQPSSPKPPPPPTHCLPRHPRTPLRPPLSRAHPLASLHYPSEPRPSGLRAPRIPRPLHGERAPCPSWPSAPNLTPRRPLPPTPLQPRGCDRRPSRPAALGSPRIPPT